MPRLLRSKIAVRCSNADLTQKLPKSGISIVDLRRGLLFLAQLTLVVGCTSSDDYVRPGTNLKKYSRIAVLPLSDYPGVPGSGTLVADFASMSLMVSPVTVIDRSQTIHILAEQLAGTVGVVDESTAPQYGSLLGVQALLTGSISEWQSTETNVQIGEGAPPAMVYISSAGVSLKLIDTETGQVVWAGTARGSEYGMNLQARAAKKAVNKLLNQFIHRIE